MTATSFKLIINITRRARNLSNYFKIWIPSSQPIIMNSKNSMVQPKEPWILRNSIKNSSKKRPSKSRRRPKYFISRSKICLLILQVAFWSWKCRLKRGSITQRRMTCRVSWTCTRKQSSSTTPHNKWIGKSITRPNSTSWWTRPKSRSYIKCSLRATAASNHKSKKILTQQARKRACKKCSSKEISIEKNKRPKGKWKQLCIILKKSLSNQRSKQTRR